MWISPIVKSQAVGKLRGVFPEWSPARYFWGASAAFVIAVILLVVSGGVFERQKTLADFTLRPDQHGKTITLPDSLKVPAGSLPLIFSEAPVDQSWVYLECQLLRATGEVAAEFPIKLAHYHGENDGVPWSKGSRFISMSLPAPGAG